MKNQKKQSGIVLMHPEIGNYSSTRHPSLEIAEGEILEFFCPLCNTSLQSDIHKNLAHVILEEKDGKNHDVYFSQISGEHSTYETSGDSLRIAGENAGRYTYFKLGDKFRTYL
ncbi:MAG TPA: hypothetical protein VK213_08705 [Bacteroidales bacterium]|nr:hypothetical protein [Bacteroidales bacterium]